jgi:cytochrome b pre-mRNA-processing protein 3
MILGFFRKDPRRPLIETLYQRIAAAARQPTLYLNLGVPDTVEGRFEAIVLHLTLTLRRLRQLPPPAEGVAQDLVDCFFRHLDGSLRELGVGDAGVPRRMKSLGAAFNGRSKAYDAALDQPGDDVLATALARNVTGAAEPASDLADYVRRCEAALAPLTLDALLAAGPRFAEGRVVEQEKAP